MWLSSVRRWVTETSKSTPRGCHESGPSRRPKRTCRLRLEVLEDRAVPATLTVTTLADAGAGSLRAAITAANNETVNPGADTIVFAPAIRGGTVGLATSTSTLTGPTALEITSAITIAGTGETITRTGAASYRLFYLPLASQLTLQNLTLSNGLAEGGAGGSGGGGAAGMGGAIYNQGFLFITGCTLVGNVANGSGGLAGNGGLGGGGLNGVLVSGTTGGGPNGGRPGINDGNGPSNGGFGGGGAGGDFGLGNPGGNGGFGGAGGGGKGTVSNGGAGGFGGGGGGGGASGGTILNGIGGAGGFGGGSGGGTGAVAGSSGGGGAGMGGAIFNQGRAVFISNSTITGNTARGGGASGNAQRGSGFGGGIFNLNGVFTLTNTTVAGNTVAAGSGGVANTADGGALYNLSLTDGTGAVTVAAASITNSILANSTGGADVVNRQTNGTARTDGSSSIVSVAAVNAGGTVSGFTVANPNLGPLANNGGFTQTMALLPGSPAINGGSNAAATGLTTDQRGSGFMRINGTVDIGAFEVQPPKPPPVRSLVATLVSVKKKGKRRLRVVVRFADTGAVKTEFNSPFQKTAFRQIAVLVLDTNGDGTPDAVQVTALKVGPRKKRITKVIPV